MKKVFAIQANMIDRADTAGCNGAGFNGGAVIHADQDGQTRGSSF